MLSAILLLVLNDHWWKGALGGWWTGKLSDVCGLVFFPLLLQAAWEVAGVAWRTDGSFSPSRAALGTALLATGIAFALVQVWPPATSAWRLGIGALQWPLRAAVAAWRSHPLPDLAPVAATPDITDLIALPALIVPLWLGLRRSRRG